MAQYPTLFEDKLRKDPSIRAGVDSAIANVSEILRISHLPFFPDYTDHGISHLDKVLEIAEKLISKDAQDVFTSEDAAVLILSVLLHDLALHLSESGFYALICSNEPCLSTKWRPLWSEFLSEAKHWDDNQLIAQFGSDNAGEPVAFVRDPFNSYNNLTESDRKLIGEFIRRHHAELAKQFAISGFPGGQGSIQIGSLNAILKRIAGTVARSHGYRLRQVISELNGLQISPLEEENVHPVFLMGVLRIADFLELGPDRAPLAAFKYKDFKSPISRREWEINQAFRKISWGNPDSESIRIPAFPTDVRLYLVLKDWLRAIQAELDTTWAVLGETYSGHQRLSRLGLTIRRVRSNVTDDPDAFAKSSSFVPRKIQLTVSASNIPELLIRPLYGDRPEMGIRELVQNAVDAVCERREFEKTHAQHPSHAEEAQDADVTVWLDDPDDTGNAILTVRDCGIGMSEDVISNYFLKIGASFRKSIQWKEQFEIENNSADPKQIRSRILRSGRFGIGILAAFLLGDEIKVSTRHISSSRGIKFSLTLDKKSGEAENEPIQADYDASLPIGTTIQIKVTKPNEDYKANLGSDIFSNTQSWDWYCLQSPSVMRLLGRGRKALPQASNVPSEEDALSNGWYKLESSDYRTVHALPHGESTATAPDLVCNGINIRETGWGWFLQSGSVLANWKQGLFPDSGQFKLRIPRFSVFDPDGRLPLNLKRTGLTDLQLDFLPGAFELQAGIAIKKIVSHAPADYELSMAFLQALNEVFEFGQLIPIFFTKDGISLLTAANLDLAKIKTCLLLHKRAFRAGSFREFYARYDAVAIADYGPRGSSAIYSLNLINQLISTARVFSKSKQKPVVAVPLRFKYKEKSIDGIYVYRTHDCMTSLLNDQEIQGLAGNPNVETRDHDAETKDDFIAAELFLKAQLPDETATRFSISDCWKRIVGSAVIPFNIAERESRLGDLPTPQKD